MEDESFGRRLRAERERRRITLELIALNTKIPINLLRDLEQDRLAHWPGGIFRRSFVKSYALAIGLDPDETLQQFLDHYPEATDPSGVVPVPSAVAAIELPRRRALKAGLRLHLADEPRVFAAGQVLMGARRRIFAASTDMAVPTALAGVAYLLVGLFWEPLAVAAMAYFIGGIVALGNTPGICLFAPKASWTKPPDASRRTNPDDVGHLSFEESLSR